MHPSTWWSSMSSDCHQNVAERLMVEYVLPNENHQSYSYFDDGSFFGSVAPCCLPSSTSGDIHVMTDVPPGHGRDQMASRNQHREAEKQRRKRINSHLDKLRNLLPSTSKRDKATLLCEAVQHIKQLKKGSSEILPDHSNVLLASESDEIFVQAVDSNSNGPAILKASLCCEDRTDLLPELMETFKSLRLRILHAEMATLGGRLRTELLLAAQDDDGSGNSCGHPAGQLAVILTNAFKMIVEKQNSGGRRRRFLAR